MKAFVGLDIGGTKFLVTAANRRGKILRQCTEPAPFKRKDGIGMLHDMISRVSSGHEIAGMGASVGGPLNWKTGVVSPLHQPQWRNVPLKRIMREKWKCPFFVDVDTNVGALGEYLLGGFKVPRLLYITLSTGMGGGLLVDGKVYRGKNGSHPEIAHQGVPCRCMYPERVKCECGASDCLEGLVSGNGIRRIYKKPAEQLSTDEWGEVAFNLGMGLRNIATLYAPDLIVFSGGVAMGGGKNLLNRAAKVMKEGLMLVPAPRLRLSRLKPNSPLMGAIALAKDGKELGY